MTAQDIIAHLDLQPHPEGGHFKETYRSQSSMELDDYQGKRNYSTAIYYLVSSGVISAFHKIKQDEMWHFYTGSTLELHIISKQGSYKTVLIGNRFELGEVPQYVIKGGAYFAARVVPSGTYSLVGCTVSPGFDFKDFIMPSRKVLLEQFPMHARIITELSYP